MFSRLQIERTRLFGWIALLPISFGWALVTWARRLVCPRGYRSLLPVVCVGNLHAGGSGKTPLVQAIVKRYADRKPAILSRGYRGKLSRCGGKVDRCNPDGANLFGDEAWMLSRLTNSDIYIDRDRKRALKKIEAEKENPFVVMDDGFQHLRVTPSLSLICVSSAKTARENFCLPLGDLREPWTAAKHASAVVLVDRGGMEEWRDFFRQTFPALRVFSLKSENLGLWDGERKVAHEGRLGGFCGLADPAGFVSDLVQMSQSIFLKSFPDHHQYTKADVSTLIERGKAAGVSTFVTTDKDWFKVRRYFEDANARLFSLRTAYAIPSDLGSFLDDHLRVAG